jgi:hypothetical protein
MLNNLFKKILSYFKKERNRKIGRKPKEKWYPTYAPHRDIKTGKSILDDI